MRVLMVCLGNICRSPLAEGVLKQKATQQGLPWFVDSAGTGYWHVGELPDPRSISVALQNGIDIRDQRARQFVAQDFELFDLILAMDVQNRRDVLRLAQHEAHREKVRLFLDALYPDEERGVPDPYYDDDAFESVFHLIERATEAFIAEMQAKQEL